MNTGDFTIRSLESEDIPAVACLAGQLGYPSTARDIEIRFNALSQDAGHRVFVSLDSSANVVGWIHVYERRSVVTDRCSEIGGLVVDEHYRGQRIGEQLLSVAENWSRERALHSVWLSSNVSREDAHRFYSKHGYETVKTSHRFRKSL
jgi:ribosomal protein S18 acetylase RimI-like enzyme